MIKLNIVELLKKNGKTKYWLCQRMNITSRNLNRIINGYTTSISFKYKPSKTLAGFININYLVTSIQLSN